MIYERKLYQCAFMQSASKSGTQIGKGRAKFKIPKKCYPRGGGPFPVSKSVRVQHISLSGHPNIIKVFFSKRGFDLIGA